MRVVHLDTGLEMRGGQWQVYYLTRGLVQRGIESIVLAPPESELYQRLAGEGLDVEPLTWWRILARGRSASVVHAHTGRAHTLASCLLPGERLVVARRVGFGPKRGPLSRWKYRRARRLIAVSRYVARKLELAGIPARQITVIYDGVPLLAPSTHAGPAVALQSRDPGKAGWVLREAVALAGVPFQLVTDLRAALESARLFVYLSREEGLGSAVLLAMSAAVPVVASRVGGLTEVVEDGWSGFLVENEPGAVAEMIDALYANVEQARQMGRRARARVQANFSVDRMVDETLALYEEICAC